MKTEKYWEIIGEGRTKKFTSKKEFDDYIKTHRPADDYFFTVKESTVKTYIVNSMVEKTTVNKKLMLDLVHYLGEKLKEVSDKNIFYINGIRISSGTNVELNDLSNSNEGNLKQLSNFLINSTIDDIGDIFKYNQTNYKPCHNYSISFSNAAQREYIKKYRELNKEQWKKEYHNFHERRKAIEILYKEANKNLAFETKIQLRENSESIVFDRNECFGRNVSLIISKKESFGEKEYKRFKKLIDKIFEKYN